MNEQSDSIEPQQIASLYDDLLELTDGQLAYVVVETTVVRHEKTWRALGVVACLSLLLSSSYTPMDTAFNPTTGLLSLLVVAFILAAAAYLLRRRK